MLLLFSPQDSSISAAHIRLLNKINAVVVVVDVVVVVVVDVV